MVADQNVEAINQPRWLALVHALFGTHPIAPRIVIPVVTGVAVSIRRTQAVMGDVVREEESCCNEQHRWRESNERLPRREPE